MANEILVKEGTRIVFGNNSTSPGFSPADSATDFSGGIGITNTLTLATLADDAARQSDKVDLGEKRASRYACYAAFDFTGETPVIYGQVHCLWLPSTSEVQANGNAFGNSGADGAAPDGALGSITLNEYRLFGQYIGSMRTTNDGVVQAGLIGSFEPLSRFGQLLVVNESGDAFENNNQEHHVVLIPLIDELQ